MIKLRNLERFTFRVLSGCCLLAASAFTVHAQPLTFTTFAGPLGGAGAGDGTGSAARFSYPEGMAIDSGGNLYVADYGASTIRKITPAGVVTTLAGLSGFRGSADGTGGTARFDGPAGVATDSAGNVYVADYRSETIRKITPAGVVTTLAGLAGQYGSADGTGSTARFSSPSGVATDSGGNVYVADFDNSTVRKITPAGVVTTLAGLAGEDGSADGTGRTARFVSPTGVATDSGGNVYVSDSDYYNNTIRKITPAGVVTTLAGGGGSGYADGTGSAARFDDPEGMATDSGGNIYVADYFNRSIRKITPGGVVTTLAGIWFQSGSADGTGSAARFSGPWGVAADSVGNVYVADELNNTIRKITPAGVVTTFAGSAVPTRGADGTGSSARFATPIGVATDRGGNLYVADNYNDTIRKITPAGVVTTLAGLAGFAGRQDGTGSAARFSNPWGVATDSGGNVYVGDYYNHTIRKINPAGVVTTLAGAAGVFGSADGTGSAARFYHPLGVATDSGGNVYVAEQSNTIRKITPDGLVTTLARLAAPGSEGVATDSGGNVYVADNNKNTIRKITPAGVVTTLAGLEGFAGSQDGTGSAARFSGPSGVATDSGGNVYVADTGNHAIRKITPAGLVTTLGGSPGLNGDADGTGSTARFDNPLGVAIDSSGNVYVADSYNNRICVGRLALADAATIDLSTGTVGTTRQLTTTTQTATSWHWTLILQPPASSAQLFSTSTRNPLFTPDVAGLYIFQLTASNGVNTSITTVSLTAKRERFRPAPSDAR